MRRFIDILSVPVSALVGCKVTAIIWADDQPLALLTAGYFFILVCDFILEAIDPRGTRP